MGQRWERRNALVAISPEILTTLLHPVFPGHTLISAELLTEGFCNTNYKVQMSDMHEAFVLRLYIRDKAACQKDVDIYNLVHTTVPIPEMLYADTTGKHVDAPYAVMRWVDGVLLSNLLATQHPTSIADAAYSAGTTLAAIGTHTFLQSGFFGPELAIMHPFNGDVTAFLAEIERMLFTGLAGQRLGLTIRNHLWSFIIEHRQHLNAIEGISSLVHGDFKGINILMHQQHAHWQVAAVLDWEFAMSGSPLFDIAIMLRDEGRYPPQFAESFARGFVEAGGQLPADWKQTIKLLDLINLCDFLDSPGQRDIMVGDVTRLIMTTLE